LYYSCFFFSSRRRHTRSKRDWSSDVCSSDLTMSDTIFLNGLKFYSYHGALPAENDIGQIFIVDVTMKVDLSVAGQSDDVKDTVHYGEVFEDVKAIMEGD